MALINCSRRLGLLMVAFVILAFDALANEGSSMAQRGSPDITNSRLYGPGDVYANIPVKDEFGRDQLAMFRMWNPDPVAYHEANLEALNPLLAKVEAHAKKEKSPVVAISASLEAQIADLSDDDKQVFLADIGLEEPGLARVIRTGYSLLGLQTYFTAGEKEVRAWTVKTGSTAPQAAGVIHTDFERGFIRAEVIAYPDYVAGKGEHGAKEAGKLRVEGKDYVVHDGDVMHFRFNV